MGSDDKTGSSVLDPVFICVKCIYAQMQFLALFMASSKLSKMFSLATR